MTEKEAISFNKENVYNGISKNGYGWTCFAKKDFKIGDKVVVGFGKVVDHQTPRISIQIGFKKHYKPKKWTGRYWNHSCSPNTYIKTRSDGFLNLVALKNIKKGDEITFLYAMSEFEWIKNADENHINCLCGEPNCKGKILSFSQLSETEQITLRRNKTCSKYLLDMV